MEENAQRKAKPFRSQTQMQRLGLGDKGLHTQAHDNICLWLKDNNRLFHAINRFFQNEVVISDFDQPKLSIPKAILIAYLKTEFVSDQKINDQYEKAKKELERPYFYGSIEMATKLNRLNQNYTELMALTVDQRINHFLTYFKSFEFTYECKIEQEKAIVVNRTVMGFIDLSVIIAYLFPNLNFRPDSFTCEVSYSLCIQHFLFNVKTEYGSLGELLLEINTYREFTPRIKSDLGKYFTTTISKFTEEQRIIEKHVYFVVGPPNPNIPNFERELEREAINFIECPNTLIETLSNEREKRYLSISSTINTLLIRVEQLEKKVQELTMKSHKTKKPGKKHESMPESNK